MNNSAPELRAFIGIPLDGFVHQFISDSLVPLKAQFNNNIADSHNAAPEIPWVKPENWHITLAFLGQIPEHKVSDIKKLLVSCLATMKPFKAELMAISGFPYPNSRIMAAVFDNNDAFQELYGRIQEMCKIAGLRQEHRAFKPHITLARIKDSTGHKNKSHRERTLRGGFRIPRIQLDREVTLDRVQLFKSHLSHQGSRYEILAEILLAG